MIDDQGDHKENKKVINLSSREAVIEVQQLFPERSVCV
jgi:hypothetical protein